MSAGAGWRLVSIKACHLRHAVGIFRGHVARAFLGRKAFERGADAGDFVEPLRGEDRQGDTAIGQQHQHMLGHQSAQSFAHRHDADAEGLREGADGHGRAGGDLAGNQRLFELLIDFFIQRAAAEFRHIEPGFGRSDGCVSRFQ